MAVDAVAAVVLEKLTDLLIQDSSAFVNVIDQIEGIRVKLREMRCSIGDARLGDDPQTLEWTQDYLDLLFSAEDEIESYGLSFQRRGFTHFAAACDLCGPVQSLRRKLHKLADEIQNHQNKQPKKMVDGSLQALEARDKFPSENPNPDEQETTGERPVRMPLSGELHPDAVGSLSPLNRPRFDSFSRGFPTNSGTSFRLGSLGPPEQDGPLLIGFTKDRTELVDRLMGKQGGVIPLVGRAGCGKTTLVQTIFHLREIKRHFSCRAWVHVPEESITFSNLLDKILQQLPESKEGGNLTVDQRIAIVNNSLRDKTYLIVVDHVRELRLWDQLKPVLPNLGTGWVNKVILITRNDGDVASSISAQENCGPHHLETLCGEHSWQLFTSKSCHEHGCSHLDNGFKGEILNKCSGCPLDIVLLGGLLSTKGKSCQEWKWYLSQAQWRTMGTLPLSYNDLPAYSKLCLLYMALFPNEVDIPVRRLLRLWLAEGFIRQTPGVSQEDTVEGCFDELVQRNLIKISKFRSDGSPRRCRLPRALREYLSPIAQEIRLFYIHQDLPESQSKASVPLKGQEFVSNKLHIRRFIEYVPIDHNSSSSTNSTSGSYYEKLRSYVSFNFQKNDNPAQEVGNIIRNHIGKKGFGVLRVLDLEGVYKPTLPETLKQLLHLRYLGLRWTFIDHLPASVGDLPYLETLDLKRTYINSLPNGIRKLSRLRHLNLPGIRLDSKQKRHHSSLTKLRTLMGLIVDDETHVEKELEQLGSIRELGIICQLTSSKHLISWIQKLAHLKFLSLKSRDEMGQPSQIDLEPLSELSHLSHVSLLGELKQLPTAVEFPGELKVLALSVSRLNVDPMPILSSLPHLSVLRLLAESYLGTEMNCPRNGFKKLRVLKLWMLKNLEKWKVEEKGMSQLRELNIRCCSKLEELPSQLLHQDTLEELTLTNMPKEFVEQVKHNVGRYTVFTDNAYEFTPLPWEKEPGLWEKL